MNGTDPENEFEASAKYRPKCRLGGKQGEEALSRLGVITEFAEMPPDCPSSAFEDLFRVFPLENLHRTHHPCPVVVVSNDHVDTVLRVGLFLVLLHSLEKPHPSCIGVRVQLI